MPVIEYEEYNPSPEMVDIIRTASGIMNKYKKQGYSLTLRQLYYRFVAGDLLPERWRDKKTGSKNNIRAYKNLGSLMGKARMGGLLDWKSLEDRTRNLKGSPRWDTPKDALYSCADWFHIDFWRGQEIRPEVWVEKDALIGIVGDISRKLDTEYFSCRGYTSLSEIWSAAQRHREVAESGQTPMIIHLGDHDPSGCDMSRDVEDRLRMFMGIYGEGLRFKRIALNMDQIRSFNPPPSPAKITDSRASAYIEEHGYDSWELDALEPSVITDLIKKEISKCIGDTELWDGRLDLEDGWKDNIRELADDFEEEEE